MLTERGCLYAVAVTADRHGDPVRIGDAVYNEIDAETSFGNISQVRSVAAFCDAVNPGIISTCWNSPVS